MISVYSLTRAGKVHTVDIMTVGKPVPVNRSDALTVHYTFDSLEPAEKYRDTLRTHWNVSASPAARYRRSAVRCVTTGETYPTARAAAAACGVSPASLSLHLNDPARYHTAGGRTFERIEE